MEECSFIDNGAMGMSGGGGAFYMTAGSAKAVATSFTGNKAGAYGGGALAVMGGELELLRCSITRNEGMVWGGGLQMQFGKITASAGFKRKELTSA